MIFRTPIRMVVDSLQQQAKDMRSSLRIVHTFPTRSRIDTSTASVHSVRFLSSRSCHFLIVPPNSERRRLFIGGE